MLQTLGFTAIAGLGGGLTMGSFGGGGLVVGAGGLTVGLTGTIGFSVSVFGTGGQTLFSNLTVPCLSACPGELSSPEAGVVAGNLSKSVGGWVLFVALLGLGLDSHIFLRDEIDPVLFLLFSSVKINYFKRPIFLIGNCTNISSNSKFPPILFH